MWCILIILDSEVPPNPLTLAGLMSILISLLLLDISWSGNHSKAKEREEERKRERGRGRKSVG